MKYNIITSNVKNNTLFCWCIEDSIKVNDILECDGYTVEKCGEYLRFWNYISKYDSYTKNHEHCIPITDLKGIEECDVLDTIIHEDSADIYVFKNNVKSNIFDTDYNGDLRFYEI